MALNIDYSTCRAAPLSRRAARLSRLPLALAGLAYVFLVGVVLFA